MKRLPKIIFVVGENAVVDIVPMFHLFRDHFHFFCFFFVAFVWSEIRYTQHFMITDEYQAHVHYRIQNIIFMTSGCRFQSYVSVTQTRKCTVIYTFKVAAATATNGKKKSKRHCIVVWVLVRTHFQKRTSFWPIRFFHFVPIPMNVEKKFKCTRQKITGIQIELYQGKSTTESDLRCSASSCDCFEFCSNQVNA